MYHPFEVVKNCVLPGCENFCFQIEVYCILRGKNLLYNDALHFYITQVIHITYKCQLVYAKEDGPPLPFSSHLGVLTVS